MAREVSSDFLRIDLTDGKTRKVISACQSDTIQRTLHFLVVNAGKPLDLTNLFYAEIIVKRTDGTYLDNACVIDGNDIQYTLKSTDVAVIGENEAHLLLSFKDGTVKETPTFYLNVFSTFYNPSAIQSQSEYTALVNKVLDAQEAANDALESKNAAEAAAADAADSADEAGSYLETVSLYTSEAGSHASTAENYASEAGSYLASASNVASEVEAVSEYMSTTSEYLESASEYASEAQSYASDVGGYIASASEYASTAASEADKGSGYITSLSTTGDEYISSLSSMASEYASTEAGYLTSTSEYASAAASEASYAGSCATAAQEAQAATEAALSTKVSKSGDTMSGYLNLQGTNLSIIWNDMNGNTLRRQVWAGTANSNGNFYLYDGTKNSPIISAPLNGIPQFNGELKAEKLTATLVNGSTSMNYHAYKFGNWVYVNIRFTYPNASTGALGLVKLTDSSGNIIQSITPNSGTDATQLLSGTYYPCVKNNSNGFNITTLGAFPAGANIQIYGIFMCQ